MVELRWVLPPGTTTKPPTLQWRTRKADPCGLLTLWEDWQDVPTAVVPEVPRTPPAVFGAQTFGRWVDSGCWCRKCDSAVNAIPMRMCVCPGCDDTRCPRADDHRNECSKTPNGSANRRA